MNFELLHILVCKIPHSPPPHTHRTVELLDETIRWRIRGSLWCAHQPLWPQNSLNFMQFFGKFDKILCWRPRRIGVPSHGGSWIHPCNAPTPLPDNGIPSIVACSMCMKAGPFHSFLRCQIFPKHAHVPTDRGT